MSPHISVSELFLHAQTDERLARMAAAGHGRAFAILIERHRRVLEAHARRLVGTGSHEDVMQQALLRAWGALSTGAEISHPGAWLHRIVHNTALNELRRGHDETTVLDDQHPDPIGFDARRDAADDARAVLRGIAALPERQRLALLGTEIHGRSRRQLAAELGLSEGSVRQLVHRARAGVRSAAAVLIPYPLTLRMLRAGGWLSGAPEAGASTRQVVEATAASGLLTSGLVKAGAAVVAAGALGGGVLVHAQAARPHPRLASAALRAGAAGGAPLAHVSSVGGLPAAGVTPVVAVSATRGHNVTAASSEPDGERAVGGSRAAVEPGARGGESGARGGGESDGGDAATAGTTPSRRTPSSSAPAGGESNLTGVSASGPHADAASLGGTETAAGPAAATGSSGGAASPASGGSEGAGAGNTADEATPPPAGGSGNTG